VIGAVDLLRSTAFNVGRYADNVMKSCYLKTASRLLLAILLCSLGASRGEAQAPPSLYVYSTLNALLAGAYDGELTMRSLHSKGDFGLGTFNRLDGEMIAVDGVFYHARADGSVTIAAPEERSPLAYLTRFHAERTQRVETPLKLAELETWLDGQLGNPNLFYAVRIEGEFEAVSVRAIAAQSKPYKPLAELVATQSVHEYSTVRGTLIGLRSPAFSKGIGVPGYHWHFLSADRQHGGHVLALTLTAGSAQVESIARMNLELPTSEGFAHADQTKDRSQETRLVEGK
jgi:acetolactate decarboxylase